MIIRLGFVSTALAIYNNTPSSTFTYKLFSQRPREEALQHAIAVGRKNLNATMRILYYNAAHGIQLFRLSSSLIPLATHPDVGIDVGTVYREELARLGVFAREHRMRLSMHPSQYTLLNGKDPVVEAALRDLDYHAALLDGMGLGDEAVINIHVGGVYGDKTAAMQRLVDNFPSVPEHIQRRMTFENDDKTYTLEETAEVCRRIKRPLMLDLHHDWCNPSTGISAAEMIPFIRESWGDVPVKIHVSSPRDEKDFRAHHDYIEPEQLTAFLRRCRELDMPQVDVMVEAKMKDLAALKLAEELGRIRGVKRIEGAVLQW